MTTITAQAKYYGPTNFKGSRIRVKFHAPAYTGAKQEGYITRWMSYDYGSKCAAASAVYEAIAENWEDGYIHVTPIRAYKDHQEDNIYIVDIEADL